MNNDKNFAKFGRTETPKGIETLPLPAQDTTN